MLTDIQWNISRKYATLVACAEHKQKSWFINNIVWFVYLQLILFAEHVIVEIILEHRCLNRYLNYGSKVSGLQ